MNDSRTSNGSTSALRDSHRIVRIAMAGLGAIILFLAGLMFWQQSQATLRTAEIQAHRTAHVVATQFYWMFQTGSQALRRIEEARLSSPEAVPRSFDITEAVRDLPAGFQYALYDAAGRLLLTNIANPSRIDVSDRDYFRRVKSGEKLAVSPTVTERLTGDRVFILARRIGGDANFLGAATIAIPETTLSDIALTLDMDPPSSIGLVRIDGTLLARSPPAAQVNLAASELFDLMRSESDGTYRAASLVDGERRILGFWKIDDWPVVAVAGLDERLAFQAFRGRVNREALVFGAMFVSYLMMVGWLWQMQRRDEEREQALIAANAEAEFLLKEMHHRVKNNLQAVLSLIRLERIPAEPKAELLRRISAMVALHQEMYMTSERDRIPARRYLSRLVENVVRSYDAGVDLDLSIARVDLPGDRAMPLSMLINEIISNAFKHAFGDGRRGRLEVSLTETAPGQLRLRICDDGPGFDPETAGQNMGGRLIEAFVDQVGGSLRRENSDGHCVIVDFPLDTVPQPAPGHVPQPPAHTAAGRPGSAVET